MSSLIALADINNFYVSCERVFDPKLRDKSVVVLSNNDGCAISRSNEAKTLGIKMGSLILSLKILLSVLMCKSYPPTMRCTQIYQTVLCKS